MKNLLLFLKLPWAFAKLWWYSVKIAWLLAKEHDEIVRKTLEGRGPK